MRSWSAWIGTLILWGAFTIVGCTIPDPPTPPSCQSTTCGAGFIRSCDRCVHGAELGACTPGADPCDAGKNVFHCNPTTQACDSSGQCVTGRRVGEVCDNSSNLCTGVEFCFADTGVDSPRCNEVRQALGPLLGSGSVCIAFRDVGAQCDSDYNAPVCAACAPGLSCERQIDGSRVCVRPCTPGTDPRFPNDQTRSADCPCSGSRCQQEFAPNQQPRFACLACTENGLACNDTTAGCCDPQAECGAGVGQCCRPTGLPCAAASDCCGGACTATANAGDTMCAVGNGRTCRQCAQTDHQVYHPPTDCAPNTELCTGYYTNVFAERCVSDDDCCAGTHCAFATGPCGGACCGNGLSFCPSNDPTTPRLCVDLQTDVNNCGGCGHVCPRGDNGLPTCANGQCGNSCTAGFGDCNPNVPGCETQLDCPTCTQNCGACGNVCPAPSAALAAAGGHAACLNGGRCGFECYSGIPCGDSCVSQYSDSNCGACGVVCRGSQHCVSTDPGGNFTRPHCGCRAAMYDCRNGAECCSGNCSRDPFTGQGTCQ